MKFYLFLLLLPFCYAHCRARVCIYGECQPDSFIHQTAPPRWVTHLNIPPPPRAEGEDVQFLLLDRQVNVECQVIFHHVAKRLLTTKGIEQHAQIEIAFDPAYQSVILHNIVVYRKGQRIEYINLRNFQLCSSSLKSVVEDLCEGDTLEYSYSVKGFNPSLSFYDECPFQYPFRVERIFYRLTGFKHALHKSCQPSVCHYMDREEWVWSRAGAEPYFGEESSSVEVGEFATWREVSEWGAKLFQMTPLPKSIYQLTEAWKELDLKERIAAAVSFVQEKIEYEEGLIFHQPRSLCSILKTKSADTVDKTYLLLALLKSMGVEAVAVGVSAKTLESHLPSPTVFNHLLLRLSSSEFIDPCGLCRKYCSALLLDGSADGAVCLGSEEVDVEISSTYLLQQSRLKATLLIESTYQRKLAKEIKRQIEIQGRERVGLKLRALYQNLYGDIEEAAEIEVFDDAANHLFIVREKYLLCNPWQIVNQGQQKLLRIATLLQTPLLTGYCPLHVVEKIQVVSEGSMWRDKTESTTRLIDSQSALKEEALILELNTPFARRWDVTLPFLVCSYLSLAAALLLILLKR